MCIYNPSTRLWDGSLGQELPRCSQPASLECVATKSKETLLKSKRVEGGDQLLRVVFWPPHAHLHSHTWYTHVHLFTCAKVWVLSPEIQKTLYIGSFDSELNRTHGFSCPLHILLWQPHTSTILSVLWALQNFSYPGCDWLSSSCGIQQLSVSWVFSHELWLTGLVFSLKDCVSPCLVGAPPALRTPVMMLPWSMGLVSRLLVHRSFHLVFEQPLLT